MRPKRSNGIASPLRRATQGRKPSWSVGRNQRSFEERGAKRALSNDFDALAIIAPPKTLGELRKALHKEAARRVVCEIPKEMTGHTIADIEKLLISTTKAEEPAEV